MRNKIIAMIFAVFVCFTTVWVCFHSVNDDSKKAVKNILNIIRKETESEDSETGTIKDNLKVLNSQVEDQMPAKIEMIKLNGSLLKSIGMRSFYNNSYGLNITTTGYNVGRYNETTTDYEVEQIKNFKEYLDGKGIRLLYVSEPAKYIDDDFYTQQFGGESFLNKNTDLFLKRIEECGIPYIDLRDNIIAENKDPMSLFYRTDHHWTVPASMWAAGVIAERLNRDFGYHIDMSMYDENNYDSVFYEKSWLGEQGRKISDAYIGLDDYTMLEPKFPTSYTIVKSSGETEKEGDFSVFINKKIYSSEKDIYSVKSWHYSYNDFDRMTIHNNNADYGNVLVLGDSYESSMAPFLSLGIQNMEVIVPRSISRSVRDYVEAGDYDTVIMAYTQFMIGAHDSETNANRNMFTLD